MRSIHGQDMPVRAVQSYRAASGLLVVNLALMSNPSSGGWPLEATTYSARHPNWLIPANTGTRYQIRILWRLHQSQEMTEKTSKKRGFQSR